MALTKVSGDILDTGIVVAGVVTATSFDGPITGNVTGSATSISGTPDITVRNISGVGATFTGNVSIGGTLTYQDVTNVDSTGIATARVGLDILSGGLNIVGLTTGLHVSGVSTFIGAINGNVTGNVTGNISGGTVAGSTGTFSGDVSIADKIIHTGDTNTAIRFPSADTISFETDGTPRLNITSAGKVGIGTDNPAHLLHLEGASPVIQFEDTDNAANIYSLINAGGSAGRLLFQVDPANAGTNSYVAFDIDGGEKLRITSGGNLKLPDNAKIELGGVQTGAGDLQIYHSAGSDSTIHHTATSGSTLRLRSRGFTFKNQANSQTIATLNEGDACKLFFSGGEKIATTGSGISVTGKVVASGEIESAQDYPNYRPTLDLNFAAVKKLDPRITYYRTGPASYTDEFGKVVLVGDNTPRFDHDVDTRESKGLLIEESRTNKVNYSQTLETGWTANNAATRGTRVTDASLPDGSVGNLWEVIETSSNSMHLVYQQMTGSDSPNNTACTISAFAKPGLNRYHFVLTEGNTLSATACFNVQTGTVVSTTGTGSPTATISGPYGDGWYRCSMTYTTASTQNYINIQFGVGNDSGSVSYAGDGSSSIAVWGVQHEVGGFLTSFIPTYGTSETRGVDTVEIEDQEFTEFYNQKEGTLMVNGYTPPTTLVASPSTKNSVSLRGSSQVVHSIRYVPHASSATSRYVDAYQLLANGTNVVDHGGSNGNAIEDRYYKHITTFKKDDYAYTYDGASQVWTDTSADLPEMDRIIIGENPTQFFLKRVVYYPKRLPNSQLTTLVS